MIQELAAPNPPKSAILENLFARVIRRNAERMLHWEPVGSIVVEFPNGRTWRYGRADGSFEPRLKLKNYRLLRLALARGSLGFAQCYIDGDVECDDLVALMRFFLHNIDRFIKTGGALFRSRTLDRLAHLARRNSKRGSKRNISEHYDLGNDFYELWLDGDFNYSSALYDNGIPRTLEEAQAAKLDLILSSLGDIKGKDILEIGCGWGALARRAIKNGAHVTGVTLSHEQLRYAKERAETEGLSAQCEFRLQDYRDIPERYDHIMSVEMIEAVGEENWPTYFETLHKCLKPGGTIAIQAITIKESEFDHYRRGSDFIQRYIFPGGMLPTNTLIKEHAERVGLVFEDKKMFGLSYARTLRAWRQNFESRVNNVMALGFDDNFIRKWRYYLFYCEAGFLEGNVNVGIFTLSKPM